MPKGAEATALIAAANCCIWVSGSRLVKVQLTGTGVGPWVMVNVSVSPIRSGPVLNRSVCWMPPWSASCGLCCTNCTGDVVPSPFGTPLTPALRSTAPWMVVVTVFATVESIPAPPPARASAPPRAAATGMACTLAIADRSSTAPAIRWRWACSAERPAADVVWLAPSSIVTMMLLSMRLLFWAAPTARVSPDGLKATLRAPPSVMARLTWLSPVAVMIRSPPETSVLPLLSAAMALAMRESLKAPEKLPLTKPAVRATLTGTAIAS